MVGPVTAATSWSAKAASAFSSQRRPTSVRRGAGTITLTLRSTLSASTQAIVELGADGERPAAQQLRDQQLVHRGVHRREERDLHGDRAAEEEREPAVPERDEVDDV